MTLLHIYQRVYQWKNFENRLTFGEVMSKSSVSCFLTHGVQAQRKITIFCNSFKCIYTGWQWYNFVPYLCQLIFATMLTQTHLTALCPGLPRWASTRKVKPIWILLKQETVSGSGISWAICKSAHRSRQITTPAPHHSVFYRPDALPAAQPTVSKHWRNRFFATIW